LTGIALSLFLPTLSFAEKAAAKPAQKPAQKTEEMQQGKTGEYTVSEMFDKKFLLEKPRLPLEVPIDDLLPPISVPTSRASDDSADPELERTLTSALGTPESDNLAKPWLPDIPGPVVARFQFQVPKDRRFSSWKLQIADSEGNVVSQIQKSGKPPEEVEWDGKTLTDQPVKLGATYTYRLLLTDRYGRTSTYLGKSFELKAMQYEQEKNLIAEISIDQLFAPRTSVLSPSGRDILERALQTLGEQSRMAYAMSFRDSSDPGLRKERLIALKRFISPRIHVAVEDLDLEASMAHPRDRVLQIVMIRS
jgi:DNA topoisomerase VI subunit B